MDTAEPRDAEAALMACSLYLYNTPAHDVATMICERINVPEEYPYIIERITGERAMFWAAELPYQSSSVLVELALAKYYNEALRRVESERAYKRSCQVFEPPTLEVAP